MSDENKFFTEVGEEVKDFSELAKEFERQAYDDGYPESIIKLALEKMSEEVKTYDDFENLVESAMKSIEDERAKQSARRERIKRAVSSELDSLHRIKDPALELYRRIKSKYNTSAVKAMTMIHYAEKTDKLDLEMYEKPIYQLILQYDRDWVKDIVDSIHNAYVNNPEIDAYIVSYIKKVAPDSNVEEYKKHLLDVLPENIKAESSPDVYKQLQSIFLATQTKAGDTNNTVVKAILGDDEAMVSFGAAYEKYLEKGIPEQAAEAMATEDTLESMPEEARDSLFKKVGSLAGKVVSFKYQAATDFQSAFKEQLGPYADTYFAKREEINARKEERRIEREERKAAEREAELRDEEPNPSEQRSTVEQPKSPKTERRQRSTADNSKNNYDPRYNNVRRNEQGRDFSPELPSWLTAGVVHLFLVVILWVIFGGVTALFCGAGALLATVGLFNIGRHAPKSMETTVLGYGLMIIGVLLGFM